MDKKIRKIMLISVLIVAAIALLDILALRSLIFGSYWEYTAGLFLPAWWYLFRNVVFLIMALVGLTYFILTKDKSEAIAVALGAYILWIFGLADIFYFWVQWLPVPSVLSHLNNHPVIGWIGKNILGSSLVTNVTLYVSALIGLGVSFITTKLLKEKF